MNDLIIVGAGPAGMSAALNAQNDGIDFSLFESKEAGWFPRVSVDSHYFVDNYLGFRKTSGTEIIRQFQEHLKMNNIPVVNDSIVNVMPEGNHFMVYTSSEEVPTKTLLLANGTVQRELVAPGIERFLGKSIFYYCVPEGPQFSGKNVVVIGGRNTGAVTALYLKEIGCKVHVIEKDSKITAKDKYALKIKDAGIPYHSGREVTGFGGTDRLESVKLRGSNEELEEIAADGVFICIGLKPNNALAKTMGVRLDEQGYVCVDKNMSTNIPGVYAAGDITGGLKQMVVAAAQGSIAAYNISKYPELSK